MTPHELKRLDRELNTFLDDLTRDMGRPERRAAMRHYVTGLLLDGERKSAVAMAGRLVSHDVEAEGMRQRLQQCVAISAWDEAEVFRRLALKFESALAPEVFVVDDTGFPKKGEYSVGVARQYSGTLGRIDNCQVASSLHLASDDSSACIGFRLYLPEEWASDIKRRRSVGVPDEVVFARKWELALELLDEALAAKLPPRLVLADAGYGDSTEFRDGLVSRKFPYLVGLSAQHTVWPPGSEPKLARRKKGPGRPRTRHVDGKKEPVGLAELAEGLEFRRYQVPGADGRKKSGRFAFARVRLAERRTKGRPPSEEVWIIVEHREAKKEYRFHVSNLPKDKKHAELVRLVKLRWRVERDYQELKGEIGLDHFEGRTWRGFHHHAALCAAAHGFLALSRRLFPPEENATVDTAVRAKTASVPASQAPR